MKKNIKEDVILNARQKVDEASFFLSLMDRVEVSRESISKEYQPVKEFTFFLSAYLNACYSSSEHLKQNNILVERVKEFRRQHPEFYKSGPVGAYRTTAVHYKPLEPSYDGHRAQPIGKVVLRFRPSDKISEVKRISPIKMNFSKGYFYFTGDARQVPIWDICKIHLEKLEVFIDACESYIV